MSDYIPRWWVVLLGTALFVLVAGGLMGWW